MSENDLDRVIIEENLKADHKDAKNEELAEKIAHEATLLLDWNKGIFHVVTFKRKVCKLLQEKG